MKMHNLDPDLSPVRNPDSHDRRRAVRNAIVAEIAAQGYRGEWVGNDRIELLGVEVDLTIGESDGHKSEGVLYCVFTEEPRKHIREPLRRGFNVKTLVAEIVRRAQRDAEEMQKCRRICERRKINAELADALVADLVLPSGIKMYASSTMGKVEVAIQLTMDPILGRELIENALEIYEKNAHIKSENEA